MLEIQDLCLRGLRGHVQAEVPRRDQAVAGATAWVERGFAGLFMFLLQNKATGGIKPGSE